MGEQVSVVSSKLQIIVDKAKACQAAEKQEKLAKKAKAAAPVASPDPSAFESSFGPDSIFGRWLTRE